MSNDPFDFGEFKTIFHNSALKDFKDLLVFSDRGKFREKVRAFFPKGQGKLSVIMG